MIVPICIVYFFLSDFTINSLTVLQIWFFNAIKLRKFLKLEIETIDSDYRNLTTITRNVIESCNNSIIKFKYADKVTCRRGINRN